jgi:purine-binding chemotaxis protein CheW
MSDRRTLLTGVIGGEEYALPLARVHEVVAYEGFTRVPTAPPFVVGLVQLHGAAVPVLDLSLKFGAVRAEPSGRRSVVVVQAMIRGLAARIGIAVDRLGRVFKVDAAQIQPPPPLESLISVLFLTGVFRVDERFVLCIDIDRVLGADEAAEVWSLAQAAPEAPREPRVARSAYLCVKISGTRCALPLARLHEVLPCPTVAPIPGAPPFVLGATNVRGAIVPVVDVARRHGLPPTRRDADSCLVLVDPSGDDTGVPVGVLVESVEGLVQVRADEIDRKPPFGARFAGDVVEAMAPIRGEFVPVLDTDQALA